MVQIYLSLDKLAFKLQQVGLLRHPQDLRAFAQRFSVNQSLFSIIDVGQGKERADHKIKGTFGTCYMNRRELMIYQKCCVRSVITPLAVTSSSAAVTMPATS
jgi:hypothetical protein